MDLIKDIFKGINYPAWILNETNKNIFINDTFKSTFYLENNNIKEVKEIDVFLSKIINGNVKSGKIEKLYGKYYKHIIISSENRQVAIGLLINLSDIEKEFNYSFENKILRTVIDNIPEFIFYKDKNLKFVGFNKEFEMFYDKMGMKEIIGKTDSDLPIDKSYAIKYHNEDLKILKSKETMYIQSKLDYGTFETIKTPIISDNGEVEGILAIIRDVTDIRKKENIIQRLCYTDALTKLYNRTYFDVKIQELINNNNYPIGIILGDINGIKIVNDTFGYLEGDKVIKKISKTLSKVCEDIGTIFRWGGDEFIILLPNSSDLQCTYLMNRIHELCDYTTCGDINLSMCQAYSIIYEGKNVNKAIEEVEDKVYKQKLLSSDSVRKSMLETLKKNLEHKNLETEEHTERVASYCLKVARKLNLSEEMIERSEIIGKLHDIGKISIPEYILLKPGKLTDEEYNEMKTHTEKGYRLAALLPEINIVSREILTHHERWDGRGYPLGLKEKEIPILSRVVAVADAFDAMTNDRCYCKGRSVKEAIEELKRCSGEQFDPYIVKTFINILDDVEVVL